MAHSCSALLLEAQVVFGCVQVYAQRIEGRLRQVGLPQMFPVWVKPGRKGRFQPPCFICDTDPVQHCCKKLPALLALAATLTGKSACCTRF